MRKGCILIFCLFSFIANAQDTISTDTLRIRKKDTLQALPVVPEWGLEDTLDLEPVEPKKKLNRVFTLEYKKPNLVLKGNGLEENYKIFSLSVTLSIKGTVVTLTMNGNKFTNETRRFIRTLEKGQTFIVEEIVIQDKNGKKYTNMVSPLVLRLK